MPRAGRISRTPTPGAGPSTPPIVPSRFNQLQEMYNEDTRDFWEPDSSDDDSDDSTVAVSMLALDLSPHAYSPGALLGAWARPAPTPNKLLVGHLVNPGIFFKIANCSTTTQWREYQREQYNRQLQGLHVNPKIMSHSPILRKMKM